MSEFPERATMAALFSGVFRRLWRVAVLVMVVVWCVAHCVVVVHRAGQRKNADQASSSKADRRTSRASHEVPGKA